MNSEANGNGPAVTLHDKHDEHGDDELQFGWLNIRPKQAQMLKKPVVFLVIVVSLTSSQVMLAAMLPNVLLTLKMRYNLSEKDENALTILQGVSTMVAVIVMGYLGSFRNKIRWITAGMVMTGIGGILFAMPHFMSGKYKPLNLPQTNLMRFGTCGFPSFPCSTKGVESSYMAFFVIGQILIGAGIAPLFTLVPAYIDENVQPKSMPIYIMVWYCNLLLAPVFGMTSAGFFQGFYIDLKQPDLFVEVEQDDIRWLGAWWLGYLVFGAFAIFYAVVILGFPERLPGARAMRIKNMQEGIIPRNDPKITKQPSGIFYATASLLKNKAYIFNTLALSCIVFYLAALGPFLIRVIMIKYGTHPTKVALPFGMVLLTGSAAGFILGGFLVKRIGLKTLGKTAAFICLITEAVCMLAPLLFVIPGCNESNIAGVSVPYPPLGGKVVTKQSGTSELTATCNHHCNCSTVLSTPVCGSNNVAYFDPCHAGCMARPSEKHFANCSCVPPSRPGYPGGEAKLGFCDRGCKSWAFFLVAMFVALVILGANAIPSKAVVLRCVPHNQRSYALAFQTFLHVLLGLLPGRLIKYIMDLDCNIWQTDQCGRKGICWDYKANSMSKSMTIFALLATALAVMFYFLSWYFYDDKSSNKSGGLLQDGNELADEYDESKETNL